MHIIHIEYIGAALGIPAAGQPSKHAPVGARRGLLALLRGNCQEQSVKTPKQINPWKSGGS